jgi:flagellum-specific ATP synthase
MTHALVEHIKGIRESLPSARAVASGKLVRGVGLTLEAVGCQIPIGGRCRVQTISGK